MAEAEVVDTVEDEFDKAFGQAVAAVVAGEPLRDVPAVDKDKEKTDDQTVSKADDKTDKTTGKEGETKGEKESAESSADGGASSTAPVEDAESGTKKTPEPSTGEKPAPTSTVTSEDFAKLNEKLDRALPKEQPKEQAKPTEPVEFKYSDEEQKVLADYEKEWDEHAKVLSIREKKLVHDLEQKFVAALDVVLASINEGLAPVLQNHVSLSQERHFSEIRKAHPDYETHRDGVKQWISTQPKYLQDAMNKVYEEGDTQGTIDLLTRYKRETGKSDQPAQGGGSKGPQVVKDVVSQEKVAATAPVQARRTVVQTQGVDMNDFDAAWKEAVG